MSPEGNDFLDSEHDEGQIYVPVSMADICEKVPDRTSQGETL